jgi:ferrochelatase
VLFRSLAAGGESFAYLPCLNDSPPGIEMLAGIIARQLQGWADDEL